MSAYEPYPSAAAASETAVPPPFDDILASRWNRFWALLIDTLIVVVAVVAVGLAAGRIAGGEDWDPTVGNLVAALMWLVAVTLYAPPLLARRGARNGQTLGKQLLGVRVVTTEGVPVTFGRGARRELLGVNALNFLTFGLYGLIDCPWALFDRRRQALHDKIGATYVIRADAPFPLRPGGPPAAPTPPSAPPPAPPEPRGPLPHEAPRGTWRPPSSDDGFDEARRAFGG